MASSSDKITFDSLVSELHRLELENRRLCMMLTEVTLTYDGLRQQLPRLPLDESTSVPSLPAPEAGFPGVCSDIEKGGMHSLDRVHGKPRRVLQGDSPIPSGSRIWSPRSLRNLTESMGRPSSHDFAHDDGDIEKGGMQSNHFKASMWQDIPYSSRSSPGFCIMCKACRETFSTPQACEGHTLSHLGLTPTMRNVSVDRSTMHNRTSSSEFVGPAHADSDIGEGGTQSLDRVHGEPRLAIVENPLFDVNVQGAFALLAFKTNNASSPAKGVLLYLLVFVYVFGFLSALGGKLFRSSKMGGIGSVAAALGFLLTMALLLI